MEQTIYLVEASEAARIVGCSPDTIRHDAATGRLEIAAVGPRGRLFDPKVLERYRAARRERLERRAQRYSNQGG